VAAGAAGDCTDALFDAIGMKEFAKVFLGKNRYLRITITSLSWNDSGISQI
jgi:hypothetical protein